MSSTLADIQTRFDVTHYDYLDAQADVPTVTRAACQGDVSILKVTTQPATTPIPAAGVTVLQSQMGGHIHSLHGNGFFDSAPARSADDLLVGTLTVPEGTDVIMSHPEHGALLFAAGTYRIGSQREYAGEWRAVAD